MRTLKSSLITLLLFVTLAGGTAQAQTPSPTPTAARGGLDLSDNLDGMLRAASEIVPTFVREVEKPLSGYFELIAWWLAWLVFIMGFLKALREREQADGNLVLFFVRAGVMFALLWYVGDTNGDGIRGDLINNLGSVGNSIAYGRLNDEGSVGYLQRVVSNQQKIFNNNYTDFVNNAFTVKVSNADMPVQYPNNGTPYQRLSVLYSKGDDLAAVNEFFNPSTWSMSTLFQWLNFGRGLVEFADLFLLVAQGILVVAIRLSAPFMIAVAIEREWAKRMSHNFAWMTVVVLFVMPVVSQVARIFAYLAANLAMDARSAAPYYAWDATTLKIIQQGDPTNMIIISIGIMFLSGLAMIGSLMISYMFANGKIVEAVSGQVTGWFGAGTAMGISAYSTAAGQAVSKQAENLQTTAATNAEGVTARSQLTAGNMEARTRMGAETMRSRATAEEAATNANLTSWAQNERQGAAQTRLERVERAQVAETGIVQGGRMAAARETGQLALDKAPYEAAKEVPVVGPIVGGLARTVADAGRMAGVVGGGPVTVMSRNPPPLDGAVGGGGRFGAPRDYDKDGKFDDAHTGSDLAWRYGEQVGVAAPGRVAFAGYQDGYGNRVVVDHGNGWATSYSHLSSIPENIKPGVVVGYAQTVGQVGASGSGQSAGISNMRPHLHYEVGKVNGSGTEIAGGSKVNPELTSLRPVRGGGGAPPQQLEWTTDVRGETYSRREALTPIVAAQMESDSTNYGAQYRAGETVEAGREETTSITQINSMEAQGHIAAAYRADSQRQGAAGLEMRGTMSANQVRHDGTMEGVRIRHDAAMTASQMRAAGNLWSAIGNQAASQMQSVFQQTNRF